MLAGLLSALLIIALSLRFRPRGLKTRNGLSGLDKCNGQYTFVHSFRETFVEVNC